MLTPPRSWRLAASYMESQSAQRDAILVEIMVGSDVAARAAITAIVRADRDQGAQPLIQVNDTSRQAALCLCDCLGEVVMLDCRRVSGEPAVPLLLREAASKSLYSEELGINLASGRERENDFVAFLTTLTDGCVPARR